MPSGPAPSGSVTDGARKRAPWRYPRKNVTRSVPGYLQGGPLSQGHGHRINAVERARVTAADGVGERMLRTDRFIYAITSGCIRYSPLRSYHVVTAMPMRTQKMSPTPVMTKPGVRPAAPDALKYRMARTPSRICRNGSNVAANRSKLGSAWMGTVPPEDASATHDRQQRDIEGAQPEGRMRGQRPIGDGRQCDWIERNCRGISRRLALDGGQCRQLLADFARYLSQGRMSDAGGQAPADRSGALVCQQSDRRYRRRPLPRRSQSVD